MKEEFFDNEELQKLYSEGDPEAARSIPVQKKVVFKEYNTSCTYIFPASTDDYIPRKHIARFVSAVIDKVGIGFLFDKYKGGGASAYHPAMLLKVWILGCIYRIYSCRKLERKEGQEIKKSLRRAKEVLEKKEKYEEKLEILGDRNSYSNTDHDAAAML